MRNLLLLFCACFTVALAQPNVERPYPDGNQRAVSLKGTRNTRQLGGLPVEGGTVKNGLVFRSGALCFASRDDARKLHGLGIASLIELRLPQEISKDGPDKSYLLSGIDEKIHWPMGNSHGLGKEAYESYMEENRSLFRQFFHHMSKASSYPVLYHCSAGKDRTGILTALLLESLGTPRNIIMDDYIHSRRITPKLKVQEDWLQVVFDEVDREGGIDSYLKKIGVTDQERRSLTRILVKSEG